MGRRPQGRELYDHDADPRELTNLADAAGSRQDGRRALAATARGRKDDFSAVGPDARDQARAVVTELDRAVVMCFCLRTLMIVLTGLPPLLWLGWTRYQSWQAERELARARGEWLYLSGVPPAPQVLREESLSR